MDTRVTWQEGLTFTGTADSGFSVPLGADPAVGGADDGFRPLELMGVSLAGCTAMDVISILPKAYSEEKTPGGDRLRSARPCRASAGAPTRLYPRKDRVYCDRPPH
ncbi:MAG: hypothetical protein ABIL11_17705 [Chloroflexota bacterium]